MFLLSSVKLSHFTIISIFVLQWRAEGSKHGVLKISHKFTRAKIGLEWNSSFARIVTRILKKYKSDDGRILQ